MLKNRIREYRAKYDMKQEDLAKLVGVRRETIGKLEKGIHNPSLVLAWNIAKAFNISIEDTQPAINAAAETITKIMRLPLSDKR